MLEPLTPVSPSVLLRAPRLVQPEIPSGRTQREQLLLAARAYVAGTKVVPPLSMPELEFHVQALMRQAGVDARYRPFAVVILNNEAWRPTLSAVPFNRRLLLLPKCLRDQARCMAAIDGVGLLCGQCGNCPVSDLQQEAQRLGYVVLVAEGSTLPATLLESGQVEAVIGVSCLDMLEKIFPVIESAGVPAVAIPLLQDGCADTSLDLDWLWDAIHLTSDDSPGRIEMEPLRRRVAGWFEPAALAETMGPPGGQTERIAHEWLARSGKRWRPLLAACAFEAYSPNAPAELATQIRRAALAVECFHKASLVHDDIEDDDDIRYGQKSLHAEFGVPVALNVGDFLLGEGYRLIADCELPAERQARMLHVAAQGHRELSLGQGAELCWRQEPTLMTVAAVLDVFAQKTAPAFYVALHLGAIVGGAPQAVGDILKAYSRALGIAYQIADDLDDFRHGSPSGDLQACRPSLMLALAHQRADAAQRALIERLSRSGAADASAAHELEQLLGRLQVVERASALADQYRQQAVRALCHLESAPLKALLRRVLGKILGNEDIACCGNTP